MKAGELSNGLARNLLDALNINPRYDFDPQRPQLFKGSQAGRELVEKPSGYRIWLRERLQHSGLAQALPAGQDLLPDIYEDSPWLKSLAWLVKPRNYKELATHLCRYLDWYVDRSKPVKTQRLLLDLCQSPRLGGMALPIFLLAWLLQFFFISTGPWFSIALSGLGYMFIGLLAYAYSTGKGKEYSVNKEELFFYLRENYSDAPEPAPQPALPAALAAVAPAKMAQSTHTSP